MLQLNMKNEFGTLYVVGTPIGNMEDITIRAIRILKEVDLVLCEDTRTTGKLLAKYEIKNKTASYNAHSTKNKENKIIELLENRQNIALVSDAGTPCISDPGSLIISYIRENYKDIKIVPIPGASAVISAVSVSGMFGNQFSFMGFVPHKKGRESFFKDILISKIPVVFYESCHRIVNTLNYFNKNNPDTKIMIARELTKMFETIHIDKAKFHLENILQNPKELKGEFTIIVFTK